MCHYGIQKNIMLAQKSVSLAALFVFGKKNTYSNSATKLESQNITYNFLKLYSDLPKINLNHKHPNAAFSKPHMFLISCEDKVNVFRNKIYEKYIEIRDVQKYR